MSEQLSSRIAQLEATLGCSGLEIKVCEEWGARRTPSYRRAIREHLSHRFSDPKLGDLMLLPEHEFYSISISHSPTVGGYALCKREKGRQILALGFDIEQAERIRPDIILRLTTPEELQFALMRAPHPEFLWAAKEAAYKSLRGVDQPKVLTDLLVRPDPQAEGQERPWSYAVENAATGQNVNGRGLVFKHKDLIYGFFAHFA